MGMLSGNAQNVNGTGQSVGDLKNIGYSNQDVNQLGTSLNPYQRIAKGIGGALVGASQAQQPKNPNQMFWGGQ